MKIIGLIQNESRTFVLLSALIAVKHILKWQLAWHYSTIGLSYIIVPFILFMLFQIFRNSNYFETYKTTFYNLEHKFDWVEYRLSFGEKGSEYSNNKANFFHLKLFLLSVLLYLEMYSKSGFQFFLALGAFLFLFILALNNVLFYLVPLIERSKNKVGFFSLLFFILSLIIFFIYIALNGLKPFDNYDDIINLYLVFWWLFLFISFMLDWKLFEKKNSSVFINLNWLIILIMLGVLLYFKYFFDQFYLEKYYIEIFKNFGSKSDY